MKTRFLSAGLAMAVVLGAPLAANAGDYYSGRNSYYSNGPYDQCISDRRGRGATGGILGAVVGGLAGSGVASNKNREEGAVLGAIVGAVAGNAIAKSGTQCSTVYDGSRDNYRYGDSGYSSDQYNGRYTDDYDRGYRRSAYHDDDYVNEDDYYSSRRETAVRGDCKVVYSTTNLPDGTRVREPATYCRARDGVWTRRN